MKRAKVDNMNMKSLNILIDFIAEPLAHIINLSIEETNVAWRT